MEGQKKSKKINGIEITNIEVATLRMIADFLISDRFNDMVTFARFEKCFGPLFSDYKDIDLLEVFKEIVGENKKYLTFRRLILAYLSYKKGSSKNVNFTNFMKLLFEKVIKKKGEFVGEYKQGQQSYYTRNCEGRRGISQVGVFTDPTKKNIQGLLIQYDDTFLTSLSFRPEESQPNTLINLHFNPDTPLKGREYSNDRDGISHIAGKYDNVNKIIPFLLLKCRSGKTFYVGDNSTADKDQVVPFIIGTSRCHLKLLRLNLVNKKLCYIEPYFERNLRINQNLMVEFDKIDEKYLEENPKIFEEKKLTKVTQADIFAPAVSDDLYLNKKFFDETKTGKALNEVYTEKEKKTDGATLFKAEDVISEDDKTARKNLIEYEKKIFNDIYTKGQDIANYADYDGLLAEVNSRPVIIDI